ncbi:MAG: outer membrane beta-barrel protein [Cyclobacteriaceae bacterium]|nr:outer membrane beta-barrel protein [Cyclobacteriaceae bacterium]
MGQAQEDTPIKYPKKIISKAEILAGANLIYPKKEYIEDRYRKFGYVVNLDLIHEVNSKLDIGLKMGYENKGFKSISNSNNPDFPPPSAQKVIQNLTLNYLTVTLYPKIKLLDSRRLYVGGGPYIGKLISERLKTEIFINGSLLQKTGSRPDPSKNHKLYDSGILLLIGYNFQLFKREGTFEVQYSIGLRNTTLPSSLEVRNQTMNILFGVNIFKANTFKSK